MLRTRNKQIVKLDNAFRKKQNYYEKLFKQRENAKKKLGVSMKSLMNKNRLLEEMWSEGKIWPKAKSPKVARDLMRILSTAEINRRFQNMYKKK